MPLRKPEPLPARVFVRIVNPEAGDYGRVGEIVGQVDMQLGSRRGEWWIIRFENGHETVFQSDEIEVARDDQATRRSY